MFIDELVAKKIDDTLGSARHAARIVIEEAAQTAAAGHHFIDAECRDFVGHHSESFFTIAPSCSTSNGFWTAARTMELSKAGV